MKTKHIIFLTVGIILILFGSVYTFTRPAFSVGWDLSKTGNIGDTIGGITAPIINIIGSILIFISFLAQNKANKIQANQNNFNLLHQLFRDVKDDYNNLSFSSSSIKDGKIYQGQKALSVFSETLEIRKSNEDFKKNSFFDEFLFFLGNAVLFLENVDSSELETKEKKYIVKLYHYLHIVKISKHIDKIIMLTANEDIHEIFNKRLNMLDEKIEKNYKKYIE